MSDLCTIHIEDRVPSSSFHVLHGLKDTCA